jgi:uncharacterized protein YndB with AHSA1/START domain
MKISIETLVKADIKTVWSAWNNPEDIKRWNAASSDWHTTDSQVDLREGGQFSSRMEAKDGSIGFDFSGTFTQVIDQTLIAYSMTDGRQVTVNFKAEESGVRVTEVFDAELTHSLEQQETGWQNILDNFAHYVESKN